MQKLKFQLWPKTNDYDSTRLELFIKISFLKIIKIVKNRFVLQVTKNSVSICKKIDQKCLKTQY